jgi:methyltransferase family protein
MRSPRIMRKRLYIAAVRVVRRLAARLGFDLVFRHYYSPVPDLAALDASVWERESDLAGLPDVDPDRQLDWIQAELTPYLGEFRPPTSAEDAGPDGFHLDNGAFDSVDAEILYGIIRRFAPANVLELGAGYSTLVAARAAEANRRDGRTTRLVSCDPYPRDFLGNGVPGLDELRAISATDVSVSEFDALGAGDVLFVDTTHTVKIGGEVNYLFLDVLPRLRPGVFVQVHDIFLPFEYPRQWVEGNAYYWAEQYLLQAFLACNRDFEVLVAGQLLARKRPDRLAELIPSFRPGISPGTFWMRRRHDR